MLVSLYCIDHTAKIYNVPTNTLMWLDNNELKEIKKYDRTKLTKYTAPVTTYQSSFNYGKIEYITYMFIIKRVKYRFPFSAIFNKSRGFQYSQLM